MKWLLVILSVMTFTVQRKDSVTMDGEWPYDIGVSYANTYNKGQVRDGDTATLRLTNLNGITIEKIQVYVHFNKTSGAGVFYVHANGQQIVENAVAHEDTTPPGYESNKSLLYTLYSENCVGVDELTISLVGTENSVFIEKYEIAYRMNAAEKHIVTLMSCGRVMTTMTETKPGAGVRLPYGEDASVAGGFFHAWSETEFWTMTMNDLPLPYAMYEQGQTFHPAEDCTLYAVYEVEINHPQPYETELYDGVFIYVNSDSHRTLTGVPSGGHMASTGVNPYDEDQHYRFVFTENGTKATITHEPSGTPIGYTNNAKLTDKASVWNVHHDGEETLFYATIGTKNYVLWTDIVDGSGTYYYTGMMAGNPQSGSPMRLMLPLVNEREFIYTCHPEAQGVEEVTDEGLPVTGERVLMQFGNYELRLINGKKSLKLKE